MLKRILNVPEQITYRRLTEVCTRRNAAIHAKVRLADVLPIEGSGISRELFDFALTSHYDFVICDLAQRPLFAVEFDGPQHQLPRQSERDARKDEISQRFDVILFRVDSRDLIRTESRLDRLTDLIESFFDRNEAVTDSHSAGLAQTSGIPKNRACATHSKVSCPSCQGVMVVKNGRYGPFYSCIRYPECKGSSDLPRPSPQSPGNPEPVATAKSCSSHRERLIIGFVSGFAALSLIVIAIASMRPERPIIASSPHVEERVISPDRSPVADRHIEKGANSDGATDRQINLLGLLIRRRRWSETERDDQVENVLGYRRAYSELSKREASKLITAWDDRKK